jgi:thiamine-phosphate pyrophosphorylase
MPLAANKRIPVMCLTQDGLPWSHVEQARRLCGAGAHWIQLRMKDANAVIWLETAQETAAVCREFGATFIVNDNVDIALKAGADGVHLGKLDLDWVEARRKLGPHRILGGTVNNSDDVARALGAGCLDYVGVGPWRFTSNKKNLAPILAGAGVQLLVEKLGQLPAWVIGGVESTDLPEVQATGAAGVAVSSALFRGGKVESNFELFQAAWPGGKVALHTAVDRVDEGLSNRVSGITLFRANRRSSIL